MKSKMNVFAVGGCIRDVLMGIPRDKVHDWDFAVEIPTRKNRDAHSVFMVMHKELEAQGFKVFVSTPEFFTIRAHFPRNHEQFGRTTADFVLCRRDGFSSDGRRPDEVFVGSLFDDLARRDFTMNAIAQDDNGSLIDPHNGVEDIENQVIRFVGDPMERLHEDGLRAMRAIRFEVTKSFNMEPHTRRAVLSEEAATLLNNVSAERVVDELRKMFLHDSTEALMRVAELPFHTREAMFRGNKIKMLPTLGSKVKEEKEEE